MTKRERWSLYAAALLAAVAAAAQCYELRRGTGEGALVDCEHLVVALFDESAAPALRSVAQSEAFRHAVRTAGGEFRVIDPNQTQELDEPHWAAAAGLPRDGVPWVVLSCGATGRGYKGPPPVDERGKASVEGIVDLIGRVADR